MVASAVYHGKHDILVYSGHAGCLILIKSTMAIRIEIANRTICAALVAAAAATQRYINTATNQTVRGLELHHVFAIYAAYIGIDL